MAIATSEQLGVDADTDDQPRKRSRKRSAHGLSPIWLLPMGAWAIGQLYPIVLTFLQGLKSRSEIFTNPLGLPSSPQWQNYSDAWDVPVARASMTNFGLNSVIVVVIALVVVIAMGSTAAWYLARSKLGEAGWVNGLLVALIAMPAQVIIIPVWEIAGQLGLRDNLVALGILIGVDSLPFAVLLFKSSFTTFPSELIGAALVDGCRGFGLFWRIVVPLSLGTFVAVAIVTGIGFWNEYSFTLILIGSPEHWTLPIAVASFEGQYVAAEELKWAATGLTLIPALVFYLVLNRQVIGGLRLGGVKG